MQKMRAFLEFRPYARDLAKGKMQAPPVKSTRKSEQRASRSDHTGYGALASRRFVPFLRA
jgi:hypothetical protein